MAPYRLPLFPLTVVVFPGTPQPLHIFEPRYRRLLQDCLAGNRRFGITLPGEKSEAPEPGAVGCAVEIGASEELPDGRSNILVVGRRRFVVRQLIPGSAPYHVGLVEEFDDDPASAPSPTSRSSRPRRCPSRSRSRPRWSASWSSSSGCSPPAPPATGSRPCSGSS